MSHVAQLVTLPARNAITNRQALIHEARTQCTAFGEDLAFDRLDWDVRQYCPKPAGSANQSAILYFATHENGAAKSASGRAPLPEPFGSVIKAIIRLKKEGNPKLSYGPLARMINASRSLALALTDRDFDPCRLVPSDFDTACKLIEERGGEPTTNYRLGAALEEISRALYRHRITIFPFEWKNTFRRITNDVRVGATAEKNRAKLPNEEVLDELARLSHLVTEPSDRMIMAAVKLLHCAPWRVGEINTIPADCWVIEQKIDERGPVVDTAGEPVMRHGIRYWPEKSSKPSIKWVPSIWVDVARGAIDTLMELSGGPRTLAHWYEDNRGRAWLPGPDAGPEQLYSAADLQRMFGYAHPSSATDWLKREKISVVRSGGRVFVSRADLESQLLIKWHRLDYLCEDRRKLRRSQHLFLTYAFFHKARNPHNPCVLAMTTDQHISDFLSGRGSGKTRIPSVFERFGSQGSDGTPMRINTHQFRHWLNTILQRGGLGQHLVASWSGRKEIAQNGEYDHMSGVELGEKARELMVSGNVMGALADVHSRLDPVAREAFRDSVFATAHVTEIGMCDADFIATPCPELGSCATCEHYHVNKGDPASRQRTQLARDDTDWLLERAIEEMGDDTEGASNYVEAHRERLSALDRILAIHSDPTIPNGTWIRPNVQSLDHFAGARLSSAA
jgi:hypothetical protein